MCRTQDIDESSEVPILIRDGCTTVTATTAICSFFISKELFSNFLARGWTGTRSTYMSFMFNNQLVEVKKKGCWWGYLFFVVLFRVPVEELPGASAAAAAKALSCVKIYKN